LAYKKLNFTTASNEKEYWFFHNKNGEIMKMVNWY